MAAIYLSFIKGHWGAQTLGEGGSRKPGTVAWLPLSTAPQQSLLCREQKRGEELMKVSGPHQVQDRALEPRDPPLPVTPPCLPSPIPFSTQLFL